MKIINDYGVLTDKEAIDVLEDVVDRAVATVGEVARVHQLDIPELVLVQAYLKNSLETLFAGQRLKACMDLRQRRETERVKEIKIPVQSSTEATQEHEAVAEA